MSEMKSDQMLNSVRVLADTFKMGYQWENGLIFHLSEDAVDSPKKMLAVPKSRRKQLLDLAHDRAGHVNCKKTRELPADSHGRVWGETSSYMHNPAIFASGSTRVVVLVQRWLRGQLSRSHSRVWPLIWLTPCRKASGAVTAFYLTFVWPPNGQN